MNSFDDIVLDWIKLLLFQEMKICFLFWFVGKRHIMRMNRAKPRFHSEVEILVSLVCCSAAVAAAAAAETL